MRHLDWDGCVNVRDLGGLPTEHGSATRAGLVVRADDIAALSAGGWQTLADYGVRTAIDLRFPQERTPHPEHAIELPVHEIPLFGRLDRGTTARLDAMVLAATDEGEAIRLLYVDALEAHAERIAEAVTAVAAALDRGAVVIHCAIGKDRTGIVSALLLRVADVPVDAVADDYAISHDRVRPLVTRWIEEADAGDERTLRSRVCSAPRTGMHGMLRELDERHGGAERYLLDAGVAADAVTSLRARLSA